MPGNSVSWALPSTLWMVRLDIILSLVFGNDLPGKDQVAKLGPAVGVGSDWSFG